MISPLAKFVLTTMVLSAAVQDAAPAATVQSEAQALSPEHVFHFHQAEAHPQNVAYWSGARGALEGVIERQPTQAAQWQHHFVFQGGQDVQAAYQEPGYAPLHRAALAPVCIADGSGETLLDVQGVPHRYAAQHFHLSNKDGVVIANAWCEPHGNEIQFTLPGQTFLTFAIATRDEHNGHHWELAIFDADIVPSLAWPLLMHYLTGARH